MPASGATIASQNPAAISGDRYQFAQDLCKAISVDDSDNNIVALVCWMQAEGGTAVFNPMNTTLKKNGSDDYNSAGVQSYKSWEQGVAATAETLTSGAQKGYRGYQAILNSLKANADYVRTCSQVDNSVWGTKLALSVAQSIKMTGGGINSIAFKTMAIHQVSDGGHSIIHRVQDAVTAPYDYAKGAYDALGGITSFLTDGTNWLRAGEIIGGAILLLLGLYVTVKSAVPA